MRIWVDADACPGSVKEMLFRASKRTGVLVTLIANHPMKIPATPSVTLVQVPSGFDVADNEIVKRLSPGDLVITADIPLAAEIIEAKGHALNPRGEMYSPETIKAQLTMRDFMETLRSSGVQTRGPPPIGQRESKLFGAALDGFLAKHHKAN
ncbi:MAG: YaiI/YqxD family protein [Pseudomonadota bacterium]